MLLEHIDMLAAASAQAISQIKFDKVVVWENGGQRGTSDTSSFLQSMAHTLPPMMRVLKDIGGIELPEALIRFTEESNGVHKPKPGPAADGAPQEMPTRGASSRQVRGSSSKRVPRYP